MLEGHKRLQVASAEALGSAGVDTASKLRCDFFFSRSEGTEMSRRDSSVLAFEPKSLRSACSWLLLQ